MTRNAKTSGSIFDEMILNSRRRRSRQDGLIRRSRRGPREERLSGIASRWFAGELSGLVFCLLVHSAVASGEARPSSSEANVVPCALALPGNITAALNCPDKALAMAALDEAGCFLPNSPGAMEVRRIWLDREALAADAAGRDPVVQAFMANCLVES